jgi:hypothetical protein
MLSVKSHGKKGDTMLGAVDRRTKPYSVRKATPTYGWAFFYSRSRLPCFPVIQCFHNEATAKGSTFYDQADIRLCSITFKLY